MVIISLEESSLSVNESEGSYMTCVIKDRDTVSPVTVEVFDQQTGRAERGLGMKLLHSEFTIYVGTYVVKRQNKGAFGEVSWGH